MGLLSKEQIRELIKEKQLVTAQDVQDMLKEMFADTLQEMLEAELDTELGYPKNGSSPETGSNRRNGHTKKSVYSEYGKLKLEVPRDREGEFEPIVVKNHQRDVTGIEEQILALYAKGVTMRDIQTHLNQLYGIEVSPTLISNVTNGSCRSFGNGRPGLCSGLTLWCSWTQSTTRLSRKAILSTRLCT
jgi:putative transposase